MRFFILFCLFLYCLVGLYANANQTKDKIPTNTQSRQAKIACIIDNDKKACTKLISDGLSNVYECDVEKECGILGVIYHHAGRDKEALPYFKKIHEISNLENYNQLGIFYKQNKDYANAKRQFELGCEKLYMQSCFNLGVLYENALGVKRDYARALSFYETSCEHRIDTACYNIAILYFNGQVNASFNAKGEKRATNTQGIMDNNIAQAKVYFEKACSMGHEDACEWKNRLAKDSKTLNNK
ncbi:tetratricopeptide repeat protein [Helicobacter sp. MIT 14-3879]|uniref:tetratricopeptide repeat protein n=1 Tax=Helicobacter sp. MIT 14-3879 TaxID=2040649 RepID=UPI0011C01794|nr:tetratricopeptide repeat protein [Helicobacter sp. MIT 14-3879]